MNPDLLFVCANGLALLGWVVLIFAGWYKQTAKVVGTYVVPALLSLAYVAILASHWAHHEGGFNRLPDVQLLFTNKWLVLMGWVHYLAFDLFVGAWQVRDARQAGRLHIWVVPSLVLTFLFGPLGFLVFLVLKALATKRIKEAKR
jgi:hypothetical protein